MGLIGQSLINNNIARIIEGDNSADIITSAELHSDIKALCQIADIVKRPRGNKGTKKNTYYKDLICAFDIETSKILHNGELHSIMYLWQFAITDTAHNRSVCYIGRTWKTFHIINHRSIIIIIITFFMK